MRLDAYLAQYYPEYSRSTWQKYIKSGFVMVNSKLEISPKHELGEDDQVTYVIQKSPIQKLAINIIYQDENVLVIDKPAGILTHAKGAIAEEFTVADFIKPYLSFPRPGLGNLGNHGNNRAGIVHRLDRDTSGVMIVARNEPTAKSLQKQFSNRSVKKTYLAILDGQLKQPEARVELPIERNPKKPSQFKVSANGKSAVTNYKVLAEKNGQTLVKLMPETGRTHQLRVHMAYLGAPVVGDKVYGDSGTRMFLHALSLEITIPTSQRKVFRAALKHEFSQKFPDVDL